ncbi:MAG: OmpA family protein [Saprospiraceae bacterium]|nr:OmpA family protein [Saprospiraceae bacterium]
MHIQSLIATLLLPCAVWSQSLRDSLIFIKSGEVYFDFGKADIRPEADSVLHLFAAEALKSANSMLYITAHTDAIGSNENNRLLSQRRGQAVKDSLLARNVPVERLEIKEFGEERPQATNDTDKGRQLNRRVTIDLYRKLRLTTMEGNIVDSLSGKGIVADVLINTGLWRDSIRTDSSGYYRAPLPLGATVTIDVFAPGYFFDTRQFKADNPKMKPLKIPLDDIQPGDMVDIKNLYFVGNQAILLERSKPELPKLLKFMNLNPGMKVEIAGHVNHPNLPPVTVDSWEYGLSVRRAKLVYDYLIEKKVEASRLTYKGYGNWQMRYPKARSNRDQELNRRVEIRVLETGEKLGKIGKDGY